MERQKRSRGRKRRYEKRYCETRKVSCGQFLGTVTQASKAKDEAASLRGELRLARSEQADRSILSFFFRFLAFDFRPSFPPFPLLFFSSAKKIFSMFSFYALLPFRKQDISFSKYFPWSFSKYVHPFPFLFFSNQNVFLLFYNSFLATTTICFHKFLDQNQGLSY